MDFEIPSFIFVPSMEANMEENNDKLNQPSCPMPLMPPSPPLSRWSDAVSNESRAPPKLPLRNTACKTDRLPKLPRRSVQSAPGEIESYNLDVDTRTTTRNIEIASRRFRALPRRAQMHSSSTATSTEGSSSTATDTVNLSRSSRLEPVNRSRFSRVTASLIAKRVHRKTSRPGPEARIVAARAA